MQIELYNRQEYCLFPVREGENETKESSLTLSLSLESRASSIIASSFLVKSLLQLGYIYLSGDPLTRNV